MRAALRELLTPDEARLVRPVKELQFMPPMLATLSHDEFSRDGWIFERKLDGVRCLALKKRSGVMLFSRNKQDISKTYPELVTALESQLPEQAMVDGEIVAFDKNHTSFSRLQARMNVRQPSAQLLQRVRVFLYVFDVLVADGSDVCRLPLSTRKKILRRFPSFDDPIRQTAYRKDNGLSYFDYACRHGWEGLIAKDATSSYVHTRSRNWLKFKCSKGQEFVIGGFTDPKGSRVGFGALLVGYYEKKRFRYAGKVGTGFDDALLRRLGSGLEKLEQQERPFDEPVKEPGSHWVQPALVCEVAFTEWTSDGKLRHPTFQGIRQDKEPTEVRRED
ncbi:MAG: non-homologous end-joining DNA ligase [Bdellovibrionales bacterium]|nr:non-homologous end-joining DNA ligase [Bdellovibrionales bacterium]